MLVLLVWGAAAQQSKKTPPEQGSCYKQQWQQQQQQQQERWRMEIGCCGLPSRGGCIPRFPRIDVFCQGLVRQSNGKKSLAVPQKFDGRLFNERSKLG